MAKYWFRQKRLGYGATPNSWQGWTVTIVGVLLVTGVVAFGPSIRDNGLRALWMTLGIPAVLIPFCLIAYAKTEGGWRWRSGE